MTAYYLDLDGARVVKVDLQIPYYGIPVADLELALPAATFSGQQTLTIGNFSLLGAQLRGGGFAGESKLRMTGGFGGWQQSIAAQGYQNPSGLLASTILSDAASVVGEQVNVLADTNVGLFWSREGSTDANAPVPASKTLRALCPLWWIDPSTGITQAYCTAGNTRTSTPIQSDFEVVNWDPGKGLFKIATEDPASWMPGNSFTNTFMGGATATISSTRIVCSNAGDMLLRVLATP